MARCMNRSGAFVCTLSFAVLLGGAVSVDGQNEAVLDTPEASEGTDVIVVYPDDEAADDQTRAERSKALQRRAGEQIADEPRGRAVVLGMYVQEADSRRMKVVEVGAASPAFDAGIRKGDEIVSFDGFTADSYRKWIDGIRKLMNDAPEGDTMAIQLIRDGKQINLRLRKPAARADELPDTSTGTLNQQPAQSSQPPLPMPVPQPGQPAQGYGDDNDITVAPFFGGQFGQRMGGTTDRAVAEIFRVDGAQQTAQTGQPGAQATAPQLNPNGAGQNAGGGLGAGQTGQTGARVGLAGFRNSQNGMLVMLDVGGLSPGNYLVGIEEGGMMGGSVGAGSGAVTPPQTPAPPQRQGQFEPPVQRDPPSRVGPLNGTAPANQQPSNRGQGGQPQSNHEAPRYVPRSVLAQILPDTPPVLHPSQTDGPGPNGGVPNQNTGTGGVGTGVGPTITVGTLTVDQSGTGRLQQVVEGMQVQHVLGQSIVIYSQNAPSNTALPPNLNPGAAVGSGQPATGQPATGQPAAGQPAAPTTGQPAAQQRLGGAAGGAGRNGEQSPIDVQMPNAGQPGGNQMPVAAGTIRMVSDRRPNGNAGTGTGLQPEANLPATGQELR